MSVNGLIEKSDTIFTKSHQCNKIKKLNRRDVFKMKEYVIAYTYKGQRRYEHIKAKTPDEVKDIFRRTHEEKIESCVLAQYSCN